jgi:glycosyltransferase involved in cell wall biosynthesis
MRSTVETSRPHLRVLLATPYGEDGMGGIDRLNDAIVEGFARHPEHGVSCRRLVTRGKGSLAAAQAVFATALARLVLAAARREVDLLHIHLSVRGSSYRKAVLAGLARTLGVPYVVHLHGTDYREFWEGTNAALRAGISRMFEGSARIIVLGEFWAKVVGGIAPGAACRIAVLPNATEAVPVTGGRGNDNRGVRITFLGQLGRRKGSADLLQALALLKERPGWTATMAGDGAVAETRALIRDLELDGRVSAPGWVSTADRGQLLAASDILVLPSYAENLPMVILEGFAHGIATVATPVGAIPEVIEPERNGLLVNPGDVSALAAAIERLIRDPALRERLGQAARQDHAARYELSGYLLRLAALWREAHPASLQGTETVRAAL